MTRAQRLQQPSDQRSRDGSLETTLVLDCIRQYFGHDAVAARAAVADTDWDRVLSIAAYHGIIPIVRVSLTGVCVPVETRRRLDSQFQSWAANSLLYGHELVRLQELLTNCGLRVLAFKGPTLAARLYGTLCHRQIRDLDLLVARSDVRRALEILESSGYRIEDSYAGRDEAFRQDKHVLLVHAESAAKVEIHWAIARPDEHIDLSFSRLWERREYISVQETSVATPSRNDLLLLLSVHGASHRWTSLKWVCDVAALIRTYTDAEWGSVRRLAEHHGCLRLLLVGVALARDVARVSIPAAAMHDIETDPGVRSIAADIFSRYYTRITPDFFERLFTRVRSRERVTDRVKIAASYAWTVLADRGIWGVRAWHKLPGLLGAVMNATVAASRSSGGTCGTRDPFAERR
jgi:Uncharacterised nucleotidyltransferase